MSRWKNWLKFGGTGEAKLRRDVGGRRVVVCQETFGFQNDPAVGDFSLPSPPPSSSALERARGE